MSRLRCPSGRGTGITTIAFLHIPKTAGTSYAAFLASGLPGEHLITLLEQPDVPAWLDGLDADQVRRHSLIAAHVDFSLCERMPFLRPATILRHPADRLVSWYHHLRRSRLPHDQAWRELIEGRGLSAVDFVTHPVVQRVHGSAMAEQLAGYGFSREVPDGPDETLERALTHLGSLAHLGIQERLPASVALARIELELSPDAALPHLNGDPAGTAVLPDDLRAEVLDGLALDGALYRAGVTQFEERLAAHGLPADGPLSSGTLRPEDLARPAADRPRRARGGVGDSVELRWAPGPEATVGALLSDRPQAAALPFDRVVVTSASYGTDRAPHPEAGLDWIAVGAGTYHGQLTLPAAPADGEGPWRLFATFFWCGDPPLPGAPGIPGMPEVEVWRWVDVPPGLPARPDRAVPVSVDALVRAPEDGHLCCVVGTDRPVRVPRGAEATLTWVCLA